MGGLVKAITGGGGDKPRPLPAPTPPPVRGDDDAQAEARAREAKDRKRAGLSRGRASTILSTGQSTEGTSSKRVLLGE